VWSVFILALLVAAPRPAGADVIRKWSSDGWQIGAYASDETKTFTQCRASKPVDPRTTLIVIHSRQSTWGVALASSDPFHSPTGTSQTMTFRFDQSAKLAVAARTANPNLIETGTLSGPDLIDALRRSRQVAIETMDGHNGMVSLDGTAHLLGELDQCVQAQLAAETSGQPPQSVAARPAAPPVSTPPAGQVQQASGGPDLALVATRIASNLLLQAKLPNARMLSDAETPQQLRGLGAAWTSEVGFGSVAVLPQTAGHDQSEVALNMIVGGAKACKGEFAAGRSTSLVDDTLVTKAFTACNDSTGTKNVRYFIFHREGAMYVVHAIVPRDATTGTPGESPLRDATFQAAAVKASLSQ
jgi:hypothetical protein